MARPTVEVLEEYLLSLEPPRPAELRAGPNGEGWLEDRWLRIVRRDPALLAVVRRFVEEELELYDSLRGQADAYFTARVIEATSPVEVAGLGLAPRYRSWIMASAYALALGTASMIAVPWLKGQGGIGGTSWLHELVSHRVGEPSERGWILLLVGGLAIAVVLIVGAWFSARSGRSAKSN